MTTTLPASTTHLIRAIDIAATLPIDHAITLADDIADAMIDIADLITHDAAHAIMTAAHRPDPTESHFAAILRDTLRDNTPFDLITCCPI